MPLGLTGFIPLTVQFTDTSTGDNLTYLWNFGDGNTSTTQNPIHEYAVVGDFTVTLTTTNNYGSDVKTDTVSAGVEPASNGEEENGFQDTEDLPPAF